LLNRQENQSSGSEIRWVLHYLVTVRWRSHTSADDEWLLAEELAHCPDSERVAENDAAAAVPPRAAAGVPVPPARRRARDRRRVPAGCVAETPPPRWPQPGSGWRLRPSCWRVLLWWGGPSESWHPITPVTVPLAGAPGMAGS
jgi:hypothetical protein